MDTTSIAVLHLEDAFEARGQRTHERALPELLREHFGYPARAETGRQHQANVMKVAGVERHHGFGGGKGSEGDNPMSVTGMKQGRKADEGVSRREGAKP
jgi:hypothetical protein